MRIAVNTRLLLKGKLEGIGRFTFESLKRITQAHPEHEFIFLFDRPYSSEFIFSENITPVVVSPPTRHAILWYIWFEWRLPSILKKYKADLFFSPDGWLSLRSDVRSVNVMHDLNFRHYPQYLPKYLRFYYNYFFPRFARKAARIATVSEFSKHDICTSYSIPENRVDVVYNGISSGFKPLDEITSEKVRKNFSNGEPFFFFIGLIHPRKNIKNLLLAFEKFKTQTSSEIQLVLAGEVKWWTNDIKEAYESLEYKKDVIFLGRVTNEDLQLLMASAEALTYVSCFEGFGIPVVEAFASGTPVITSNNSCLPEIAGDAALLCDPFSVDSIKDAMVKLVSDEGLRKDLIEKGFLRKKEFSWDRTAELVWGCIEKEVKNNLNAESTELKQSNAE